MIVTNFKIPVMSSWMRSNGRRLDCSPYLSGAFEARAILEKLPARKELLNEVTKDIYNGPRFARNYVLDPNYGVPFLGSTDILLSDLSYLPYLAKKLVSKNTKLLIDEDWTLITCSGTIGRMVYSRSNMKGMAGSQHFMRVVADTDKILPGYLYSYLSSKFGVPIVVSGTYGAIIQHIEPYHIKDIPVPRLGKVEEQSHKLCKASSELHVSANEKLNTARELINQYYEIPAKLSFTHRPFSTSHSSSILVRERMDATYHDSISQRTDSILDNLKTETLYDLQTTTNELGRVKQNFVESEYGIPFLTSSEIFRLQFEPTRFLSKKLLSTKKEDLVNERDLLLARSGQVGGIIGRGVWADRRFSGSSVSVDVINLRVNDKNIKAGYVYAYLFLTDVGYRQLIRNASGSSIPHISANDVLTLRIPRATTAFENQIDSLVSEAGEFKALAQENESYARKLVEQAIENS